MIGDKIFDWSSDIRDKEKLRILKCILKGMVILEGLRGKKEVKISGLNNGLYKDICAGKTYFGLLNIISFKKW